ncbi:MAG: proton-translocating NADH-quinone oxidoreductase subunit N [Pirellula sp.]|nr:proton-translocating NADH-quinone oxidoreductase subunit N [Pirellula sp.]
MPSPPRLWSLPVSSDTVSILLPELIVVLTATFIYVAGAFLPGKKFWGALALVGVAAAGFVLAGQSEKAAAVVAANEAGPLAVDLMGRYVRGLALLVGAIFVLAAARPQNESLIPEYVGTVLMAVAGLMLVGGARELTLLFLGLELISIPTYILLYLGRRDGASAESAAKYFFLSVLSSAITLYGFSYLYGVGGSTRLDIIQAAMAKALVTPATTGALFAQLALVLVFAGLGFKIAAVPFHFYAPDVYQGTTHTNAGLLAVLPKIAGIAALVRIASIAMPGVEETGLRVTMILALLTMTLGNVVALWQDNIRRMLAYSSIAHAGYMLVGLAVDFAAHKSDDPALQDVDGIGAALFYVAVYSLATAGSFAAFAYLGSRDKQVDTIDDLAGVGGKFPAVALAIAVFMFSLTGLPPLAGFWGKFALFSGAVKVGLAGAESVKLSSWFIVLSIVGVLNAAVSAAYYLRIIGVMYFRESSTSAARGEGGSGARLAAFSCALLVIAVGLAPSRLSQDSQDAATSARAPAKVSAAVAAVAQVGDAR